MPKTAKIFKNGRSQAIRLPAEFRFSGREVFIEKQGDEVILRPKPIGWDGFLPALQKFPLTSWPTGWMHRPKKRVCSDALYA
jgi:antitoxin VapB